ncbi:MAG: alpha/beta fold hydrolase [Proteobacteria bacterium]|nr:alpha/beta fold hydrolase [Pseudomonadota bacterium]
MKLLIALSLLFFQTEIFAQSFEKNLVLPTHDGLSLSGNVWLGKARASEKLPAIIFINSWSLDEYEYLALARKFSQQGYNVLSYSARGWGKSEGEVGVAGPDDVRDVSSVIDWLLAHTNTDPNRIALSGISYGAGLSLLATASDSRIKAVAALSGWADMTHSLLPGGAANELWAKILLGIGRYSGNLPPYLNDYIEDLLDYKNLPRLKKWTQVRSPAHYIAATNGHGPAILLINNWNDSLFNPSALKDYFEQLTGPKRLILKEGIHGTGEATGLLGFTNESWDEVFSWFQVHVKAKRSSGSSPGALVKFQIRGTSEVVSYFTWPHPSLSVQEFKLLEKNQEQTLIDGVDSPASTGIPVIGSFLDSHTPIDVGFWWGLTGLSNAFNFQTPRLLQPLKIRGDAKVTLNLSSSISHQNLYVYLYEVSPLGYARLITHGPHRYKVGRAKFQQQEVRLFTTAYDVTAGSRLALMIDTSDPTYADTKTDANVLIWRDSEKVESVLKLPIER